MRMVWAVMRTEMWLAWRRPTFWVVQALWMLPLVLTLITNLGNTVPRAATPFVSEQLVTSLMIWSVLLPLIVGPALTRDLGEAGETLWTTSLDALIHGLGVIGGLLLALLPALLAQLAAQWLVGLVAVGPSAMLFWRYGPSLFLASTIAAVSLAAVLALLLRRTLLLLLIWIALWAMVLQINLGVLGQVNAVGLLSPVNLFFYNLQISPALGLGLARPLVQGLVLWFIGLGVLAALLAVGVSLVADPRRAIRRGIPLVTWIVVAGLLAGSGRLLHARSVQAQAILASPVDIQAGVWHVQSHTLDVAVDGVHHTLAGASTLQLTPLRAPKTPQITLRLNSGLRMTEARIEAGQSLSWERVGDSVVIQLPAIPVAPLTLHLRWEGTPHPPHNDYGERQGYLFPAFDTPQPIRAVLAEGAGFLFRDGDWYPWPWSSASPPQQAGVNRVTLRVAHSEALATAPMVDGVAIWEGALPQVLLVLPPAATTTVEGRTIHIGRLGGAENIFMARLTQIARLLPRVGSALGDQTVPTHIVALPYLPTIVWSKDLLLVPEGTGPVSDDVRRVLFTPPSGAADAAGIEERALMTVLVRAWITGHTVPPSMWARVRPDVEGVIALAGIPGDAEGASFSETPDAPQGRWVRVPATTPAQRSNNVQPPNEGQDLRTMGNPPLSENDHLNLLSLWLAVELADPTVREADLSVLLAPPDPSPTSDKFEPFLLRALPFDFPVSQARKAALVRALHGWLERVGREQGLQLVGTVMRNQTGSFDLKTILQALEQASGIAIEYEEHT